jgi:hypothetical protein
MSIHDSPDKTLTFLKAATSIVAALLFQMKQLTSTRTQVMI